jgi:hypothetical protein
MNQADGPGTVRAGIISSDQGRPDTGSSSSGESPPQRTAANPSIPNPARVYDALLGGKDNYAADRAVAGKLAAAKPALLANVRANRAYLGRVVRHLATECGIRQFLDLGTGLPSLDNTHEVAQRAAPSARIVYVDNDPVVLAHARALLVSTVEGATSYLSAEIREPEAVLERAAETLDFGKPIAIMLLGVLYMIPDADQPSAEDSRQQGQPERAVAVRAWRRGSCRPSAAAVPGTARWISSRARSGDGGRRRRGRCRQPGHRPAARRSASSR